MLKSMTAFARSEAQSDMLHVSVELRTYNSRHLDLVVRLPHAYLSMEEKIKALITETVARGRVEIYLQIRQTVEAAEGFEINTVKAHAYRDALLTLQTELGLDTPPTLDMFLNVGDIIKPSEKNSDCDAHWPAISTCLTEALAELDLMRRREGGFIAKDFTRRLAYISDSLTTIEAESGSLVELYRRRLEERIKTLTKGLIDIDAARIAQEAAILADRSDITEELVRAASHIDQFHALLQSPQPVGRKLNFLLQELNREFNTMGSKSEKATVSHLIVDVKAELEKIREQVQNIE